MHALMICRARDRARATRDSAQIRGMAYGNTERAGGTLKLIINVNPKSDC